MLHLRRGWWTFLESDPFVSRLSGIAMDPLTRILVVGDSHIRRLREFVEAPPDKFYGFVQLSIGLQDASRLDFSFLGCGGRTVSRIRSEDMQEIQRFSHNVVILMVGGNDLTSATASALGVASYIHELALSLQRLRLV